MAIRRHHYIILEPEADINDVKTRIHEKLKDYLSDGWLGNWKNGNLLYHGGEWGPDIQTFVENITGVREVIL